MIRVFPFCLLLAGASFASASTVYDATVLGNAPVAFLPLDETSGTTANNLANPAENGTYHGVTLGVPGGPDGSGGAFTPIGTFVSAPNYPAIDATTAFTIEAWVNVTGANSNAFGNVFAINRATNSTGIALTLNGDHPEISLNNFAVNYAEESTGSVTNGSWNQVVVTWSETANGGAPLFYINGALAGSADANAFSQALALTNAPGISIGAEFPNQLNDNGRWFKGDIEDVSFYNYALTGAQIGADYAAATPEPGSLFLIAGGLIAIAIPRLKRSVRSGR